MLVFPVALIECRTVESVASMDFQDGKVILTCRVAAVIRKGSYVLTQEAHDGRALPGGRIQALEHSKDALRRELWEELAVHARVGKLLFVVENIFNWCDHHVHQLLFIYEVQITEDIAVERMRAERMGWEPIEQVSRLRLYPEFLRTKLGQLPEHAEHVCVR